MTAEPHAGPLAGIDAGPRASRPEGRGVYGMSVAAELTGVNPQNLRAYEAKGLLEPYRTPGGTRRYSDTDLARVDRITALLGAGLNLKGIEHVLALEAETERLRRELAVLRAAGAAGELPGPPRRRRGSGRA
jgi:MerR family transcriptional regulator/heat shock protein HspR